MNTQDNPTVPESLGPTGVATATGPDGVEITAPTGMVQLYWPEALRVAQTIIAAYTARNPDADPMRMMTPDALVMRLDRFAEAHAEDLAPFETYILGHAAGIVTRTHSVERRTERPPAPEDLDRRGPTMADIIALGEEGLRRHHPSLAAELGLDDVRD